MDINPRLSGPGHLRYAQAVASGEINPHAPIRPTTVHRTVCQRWPRHYKDGHEPIRARVLPR